MRRILFDSTLYIESLRRGEGSLLQARSFGGSLLWLSFVVVEELLANAGDKSAEAAVEKLYFSFQKTGRLVSPLDSDWTEAGKVLAKLGRKYGYETIRRAGLTNGALIAISARRHGVNVATTNTTDFEPRRGKSYSSVAGAIVRWNRTFSGKAAGSSGWNDPAR